MGLALPKPVMTLLYERDGNSLFRVGSACVNGHRETMEDAHLAYLTPKWGFFGVFDGHVNDQCSKYLEEEWRKLMETNPVPMTDERMKEIALNIDAEFLDANREGGSTGTFFIATFNGKVHLQVGNVGDSRVLVGRGRTCIPMTKDHKPDCEGERRRIIACAGKVENNRVDGSLAVSRAFGDGDYKKNPGTQLNQKVIALPDVTHIDLDFNGTDFAVLACDGVFEGQFPNEEVIAFIADELQHDTDLARVAGKVCHEAIKRGSKDNISCMIVQFCNGAEYPKQLRTKEYVPGPFALPNDGAFRRAYFAMGEKFGLSAGQALEIRYDAMVAEGVHDPELAQEEEFFGEGPCSDSDRACKNPVVHGPSSGAREGSTGQQRR